MNKRIITIVVVLLLLLLGGVALIMSNKNKGKMTPTTSTMEKTETTEKASPKSLKDLVTAGVPQKCTFKDESNMNTEGTSYISGGKVRGDFATTVEGKTSAGHMIFDGKTSYVWMDGTTSGFKMEVDPATMNSGDPNNQQGLDFNKSLDYNCAVWIPDAKMFTPPTDVTFSSFSIPTANPSGGAMYDNKSMCASCNSLDGDQKTQCLTALKCN